jgi:hypothetical protein
MKRFTVAMNGSGAQKPPGQGTSCDVAVGGTSAAGTQ